MNFEIPYRFKGAAETIVLESPAELICPKSVTYWRFINLDGYIEPTVTTYAWNGSGYEAQQ